MVLRGEERLFVKLVEIGGTKSMLRSVSIGICLAHMKENVKGKC